METVNVHEAKTHLSRLIDKAARGEPFIIAKAGKPMVKLVPVHASKRVKKRKLGGNVMGITYIAPDLDDPVWSDEELEEMGLA